MALNIFTGSAASVNWSATSSWTLGRIPTSVDGDTAYFGPTSPTCSLDVTSAPCYNFDVSTYNKTFILVQSLFIYGTYSNFGTGIMKFNASGGLPGSYITFMGSASITSNGYVFKREGNTNPGTIRFGYNPTSTTITLLDQFEATNISVTPQTGIPTTTFNGATISARESFTTTTNGAVSGTSNIQLRATASSTTTTMNTATSPISNSIYVNSPGIVNITNIYQTANNNIFKYISGTLSITTFTINPNGSTLTIDIPSSVLIGSVTTPSGAVSGTISSANSLSITNLTIGKPSSAVTTNLNLYGGFSVSNISILNDTVNSTNAINLSPTSSWYINNSITLTSYRVTSPSSIKIQSTQPGTKAPFIVNYNSTQDIFNTNFNDIDASGGATILPYQYNATFSNVSNIQDLKSYYIMTNQIQTN